MLDANASKTDRELAIELAEEVEINEERTNQLIKIANSKLRKGGKKWIQYPNMSKVDQKEVFDAITELAGRFSVWKVAELLGKASQTIQEILDHPPFFPEAGEEVEMTKEQTELDKTIRSAETAILADFRVSLKQLFNEDLVLGRELRAKLGGLSRDARKDYICDAIKFYESKKDIQETMVCFVRQIEDLRGFIMDMKETVNGFEMEVTNDR